MKREAPREPSQMLLLLIRHSKEHLLEAIVSPTVSTPNNPHAVPCR